MSAYDPKRTLGHPLTRLVRSATIAHILASGEAMRRRELIKLLGVAAAAWPVTGLAQQSKPRIGLVSMGADPSNPVLFAPFLLQMRELGYVEGDNIVFEKRFAAGKDELINDFVADLVRRQVDIIVVTGQRESI